MPNDGGPQGSPSCWHIGVCVSPFLTNCPACAEIVAAAVSNAMITAMNLWWLDVIMFILALEINGIGL
jgi:hypothetical protein